MDWSVAVDGGQESNWYRAAVRQKAGRILAAGLTKEVTFEPVGGAVLIRSTMPTARSIAAVGISTR